ncbi:hypothetical protein [Muricoccus vinaceus]|uniref:Uncharacterized protein n=1 Tax=Muricoccus vinaceus TaxID=424704 RepID=A0ABV6J2B5_9PROT
MSTGTMYELQGEFSPLHERPDPEFGRFLKRAFKTVAPFAARMVVGAIPGVGAIAGPIAGNLVRSLTREQQEQLEAALHELGSGASGEAYGEFGAQEFGEFGAQEGEFSPETMYGEMSGEMTHEFAGAQEWSGEGEYSHEMAGMGEFGEFGEGEMQPEGEMGFGGAQGEMALMEQIAHEAAAAHNGAAAEALAGSLVPLATRLARASAPALRRATPALAMAAGRLAGAMRRHPATRPLVRVLPHVLTRTAQAMARGAGMGQPVTPQRAVRIMAGQTYRVFNKPDIAISILVRAGRRPRVAMRRAY